MIRKDYQEWLESYLEQTRIVTELQERLERERRILDDIGASKPIISEGEELKQVARIFK